MAVAASPKLWMVSESRPTEPESTTTTTCTRAVTKSPTNDHFTAQMPRSEVAMCHGGYSILKCPLSKDTHRMTGPRGRYTRYVGNHRIAWRLLTSLRGK